MSKICLTIVIFLLVTAARLSAQFPEAEITNGLIQARLYLPDASKGYYRASRFDWSGVMPELQYQGHTYFGQWFDRYSPTLHDAIMGPVEDFSPIGYDETKPGGRFLKIGIGMVTRPAEAKYFFATPYQLVNPGVWKVKKKSDQVEFTHTLKDTQYAYEYKKTVHLVKGKPELVLWHILKNTGARAIETDVYDHNFFVMDNVITGPAFEVIFPFDLAAETDDAAVLAKIDGKKILFQKELANTQNLYYRLRGYGTSAKDYDITIENHKTGAAVRITSDQPLSKLAFWSAFKTLCPEPFIHIKIKPGETFRWKILYQFYVCRIID